MKPTLLAFGMVLFMVIVIIIMPYYCKMNSGYFFFHFVFIP